MWTLHDMWPFSGSDHYSDPQVNSSKSILKKRSDRWVFQRKLKHLQNIPITIVSPSNWLADQAKKSLIFKNQTVLTIHNGLDLQIYKPTVKQTAREILNLNPEKKYILFGALSATSDPRKGYHLLHNAVENHLTLDPRDFELLVFGASKPSSNAFHKFNAHYLGKIHDDVTLALLYSAADVMLVPSTIDNLPNTAVESIACGTPVVAFNVGGLPDIIDHMQNGYLANPCEPQDLAKGIEWIFSSKERLMTLSCNARKKAESTFDICKVAKQYFHLYKKMLSIDSP